MISEEEFAEKVAGLASVRDALTVEEFNNSILELTSRLTIARNARTRSRLFSIQDEMQRQEWHRRDEIRLAHANGVHCGLVSCDRCNGRDVE